MMKGIFLDDNMSNLTSASNEPTLSSSSNRNEVGTMYPPPQIHHSSSVPITSTNNNQTQSNKKKRNLPGNPDPDAEVVALSPKSLMATNRFMCEICNKGFQRDQNLQLHRRGHNLPWKLKQKSKLEVVKKKVYVCPEPSCVHHDPARALGDLTGIKKHFSRKHGEKKWKCEKCSKRYAVQSDWKAHSKICGTREYRCDCGTLFSRRDSFITHRAFCDALAEETGRYSSSTLTNHNLPINFPLKTEPQLIHHHPQLTFNIGSTTTHQLPSWLTHNHQENPNPNHPNHDLHLPPPSSHMSATALLQKATQIGVTMSNPTPPPPPSATAGLPGSHHDHMRTPLLASHHHPSGLSDLSSSDNNNNHVMLETAAFGNVTSACMDQLLHSSSLTSTGVGSSNIHEIFNSMFNSSKKEQIGPQHRHMFNTGSTGNSSELTRDFLGLRGFPNPTDQEFLNSLDQISELNQNQNQNQIDPNQINRNQIPWQG